MKKWIPSLLCLILLFALTGCSSGGGASGKTGNQTAGVNDVLEQGMADADNTNTDSGSDDSQNTGNGEGETKKPSAVPVPSAKDLSENIDVDLTTLSSTMVYSEVYNMMTTPEDYAGKIVKMKGSFAHYHDDAANNDYFACIIQDATACCSQGIEFVLAGDYTYPDDYPELDTEICVVGVFDTYQEGEYTYCTLRNASML